jgi:hypothetical protein
VIRESSSTPTTFLSIRSLAAAPMTAPAATSVITSVGYGSSERVHIELERGGWPFEIRMDEISQYITKRGNPGNTQHAEDSPSENTVTRRDPAARLLVYRHAGTWILNSGEAKFRPVEPDENFPLHASRL